jgi:hypothetical protein
VIKITINKGLHKQECQCCSSPICYNQEECNKNSKKIGLTTFCVDENCNDHQVRIIGVTAGAMSKKQQAPEMGRGVIDEDTSISSSSFDLPGLVAGTLLLALGRLVKPLEFLTYCGSWEIDPECAVFAGHPHRWEAAPFLWPDSGALFFSCASLAWQQTSPRPGQAHHVSLSRGYLVASSRLSSQVGGGRQLLTYCCSFNSY